MTRRLLPAALVETAIVVGVLLPQRAVPDGPALLSVAFHVLAHATLAVTLLRPGRLRPVTVLALVLASAVGSEALQLATSDRSADAWDVLADLVGGVVGVATVSVRDRVSARSGAGAGRWRRRSPN